MERMKRVSRTQTNHLKTQGEMKKLQEQMKKLEDKLKKTTVATELEKHINIAFDHLSLEEVQDIIAGIKEEQEVDVTEQVETDNTDENFQDVIETESLVVEVTDNMGPVDEEECDEVIDIALEQAEQFSDKKSLVDHTQFGTGPIRHIDSQGKKFHGVNNHSRKIEDPNGNHFSGKYPSVHYNHCHFASQKYQDKPIHPQWDHNDHQGFCTNCEPIPYLNKGKRTLTIYRCLGH